ncbi:MAG TPA: entericidin A/B family lipoprotein [Arenimonas sp.]|nr:entericidin A/B family lipoprotein [Arenimonas sp.]
MQTSLRTVSLLLLLTAFTCASTGCQTIRGFGKDTQKVGEEIEEEAERHIDEPAEQPD